MPAKVTSILDPQGELLFELGTVGASSQTFHLHVPVGTTKVLVVVRLGGFNASNLRFSTDNVGQEFEVELRVSRSSTAWTGGFWTYINGTFAFALSGVSYFHDSHLQHSFRFRKNVNANTLTLTEIRDGYYDRYIKKNFYSWTSSLQIYGPQPAEAYLRGMNPYGAGHGSSHAVSGIPSDTMTFSIAGGGASPFGATFEFDIDGFYSAVPINIAGMTTMDQVLVATRDAINSALAGYVVCTIESGCLRLRTVETGSSAYLVVDVETVSGAGWYWEPGYVTTVYGSDGTNLDQYVYLPYADTYDTTQIRDIRIAVLRGSASATINIVDAITSTSTKLVSPADNTIYEFGSNFGQSDLLFAKSVLHTFQAGANRAFNIWVGGDPAFTGNFTVIFNGVTTNSYA